MSELSPRARSLIAAARTGEDPSESDRRRVRRALAARIGGAAIATTIAAGTATGSASAATGAAAGASVAAAAGAGAATKILVAVGLLVAIGGTAAVMLRDDGPAPAPVPAASSAAAVASDRAASGAAAVSSTSTLAAAATLASAERSESAPAGPVFADATAPAPVPRAAPPPAPAPAPAPPPAAAPPSAHPGSAAGPEVGAELELLRRAQAELRAGRPEAALGLLDEHERGFANGALGEERSAARVLALCQGGRVVEARAAAEQFLAAHPTSPLAPRIRAACER